MLRFNNAPVELTPAQKQEFGGAFTFVSLDRDWIKRDYLEGARTPVNEMGTRDVLIPYGIYTIHDNSVGILEYYETTRNSNSNVNLPTYLPKFNDSLTKGVHFVVKGNPDLVYYLTKSHLCENSDFKKEDREALALSGNSHEPMLKIYKGEEMATKIEKEYIKKAEYTNKILSLNDQQTELLVKAMAEAGTFDFTRLRSAASGQEQRVVITAMADGNASAFDALLSDIGGQKTRLIEDAIKAGSLSFNKKDKHWYHNETKLVEGKVGTTAEATKLITEEMLTGNDLAN